MYVFGIILKLYLAPIFLTKDPRVWNRLYRIYSWLNDYNFRRKSPIFSLPRAQSLHRLSAVPQLYLCSLSAVSQQSLCSLSAVSQQSLCSLSAVSRSSNSWTKVRWGLSRFYDSQVPSKTKREVLCKSNFIQNDLWKIDGLYKGF